MQPYTSKTIQPFSHILIYHEQELRSEFLLVFPRERRQYFAEFGHFRRGNMKNINVPQPVIF
jgi:hypothetical protein